MTNIRNHTRDHTREHLRDMVEGLGGINFDLYSFYVDFPETIDQVSKNSPSIVFDAGGVGYSPNYTGGGLNEAVFEESGAVLSGGAFIQLIKKTRDISNATAWTPSGITIPDSVTMLETTETGSHGVNQDYGILTDNTIYTFSVKFKSIGRDYARISLRIKDNTSLNCWFNISNGTLGTIPAGVTANIEALEDGYYLCTLSFDISAGIKTVVSFIRSEIVNGGTGYTGDITKGMNITDAQLTQSTYKLPYLANDSAVATISAAARYSDATDGIKYTIEGDLLDSLDGAVANDAVENTLNGEFDTDTDWGKDVGWTISGGTANCDGTNGTLYQGSRLTVGLYYEVSLNVPAYTSGTLIMANPDPDWGVIENITTTQKHRFIATSATISFSSSSFIGSIDNVSVKQISDAQGKAKYKWTPKWSTADVSGQINILTANDEAISFLFYDADTSEMKLFDGTNTAVKSLTVVANTTYEIDFEYGVITGQQMRVGVDGSFGSYVTNVGSFPNDEFMSIAWKAAEFAETELISWEKEL